MAQTSDLSSNRDSSQVFFLKHKEHLLQDRNSTDVFYDNLVQKYIDRPLPLEDMLYDEWASKYMPDRNVGRPSDIATNSGGDDSHLDAEPDLPTILTLLVLGGGNFSSPYHTFLHCIKRPVISPPNFVTFSQI